MVPICRKHCWVTVCNRVNKSNINFSGNTPTVCQATANFKYLNGLEDKVLCWQKCAEWLGLQKWSILTWSDMKRIKPNMFITQVFTDRNQWEVTFTQVLYLSFGALVLNLCIIHVMLVNTLSCIHVTLHSITNMSICTFFFPTFI